MEKYLEMINLHLYVRSPCKNNDDDQTGPSICISGHNFITLFSCSTRLSIKFSITQKVQIFTLVNVYVDLVVFTRIAGTS